MRDYAEIVKRLRHCCALLLDGSKCEECPGSRCIEMDAADAIEELLDELVTLRNQLPKWVSVEKRLPEEYDRVLVANDDGKFMVAERAEDDWWYQYCAYDVDRWDALEQGVITHWMPLPTPPKGVE